MKIYISSIQLLGIILFFNNKLVSQIDYFLLNENSNVIIDSLQRIKYSNPESALRLAYQILEKYPLNKNDKTVSNVYNIIGEIFLKKRRTIQALEYFIEADKEIKRLGNGNYWILMNIGNVYFQEKKWIKAEEKYIEAYEEVVRRIRKDGQEKISVMSLSLLNQGMIYIELKEYEKAFQLMIKSLELRKKKIKNKLGKFIEPNYGNVSYNYLKLIDLYINWDMLEYAKSSIDSCYHYLEKYKVQKMGNKKNINLYYSKYLGLLYQNEGRVHILENNLEKGLEFYNKAEKEFVHWPIYKVNNFKKKSDIFYNQKKFYKALELLDKGLIISKLNNLKIKELELLRLKSDIFQRLKISKSALEIELLINKKIIEINNERIDDNLKNLELKSEFYINRNLLIDVKERMLFLILISGSLLIIFVLLILYYRNKKNQADELIALSNKNEKFSNQLLVRKENELVQISTFLVSKNEIINTIIKDLDYHISLIKDKYERKSFNPLIKKIKDELNMPRDWQLFQKQFSHLYPQFISSLLEHNSKLTSNDIKVCCYLKMNQSTKDIAQLTGLSVRAIENRRYRLRKKLKLDKNLSLTLFLNRLNN